MPRIGLVYEDQPIQIAVEILAPKIIGEPIDFEPVQGGSWPGILGQVPDLLQILNVVHLNSPLDCVLVIVDANGQPAEIRERRLREKVGNRKYGFGAPIYHAVVRHIEAWLLGDPDAVNTAAGKRIPDVQNPEQIDAKRYLIQVLKNERANPLSRQFIRAAFEAADLDRISDRCRGFRDFVRKLQHCRPEPELF